MSNTPLKTSNPFGDKRTALAFFLSLIVIITYTELVVKKPVPPKATGSNVNISANDSLQPNVLKSGQAALSAPQGPIALPANSTLPTSRSSTQETPATPAALPQGGQSLEELENAPHTIIDTPNYEVVLSHLGGRVLHFRLKHYTKVLHGEELYDLVSPAENGELPFGIGVFNGTDAGILYPPPTLVLNSGVPTSGSTVNIKNSDQATITFEVPLEQGGTLKKTFRFSGNGYFVDVDAELSGNHNTPLSLVWTSFFPEKLASNKYDPVNLSFLNTNDKVEHTPATSLNPEAPQLERTVRWASIGDKYFMASLIAPESPETVVAERHKDTYSLSVQGENGKVRLRSYLGPKNYFDLKKLNYDLHRNVNLGIFSFLAIPLLSVIYIFHGFLGNYGLAIILLTLLIKFLFLPLTQVSFKSMKAMQDLQPEIKALRERISDPNQLNQEMFALYKRKGVNPMGGCFPMLIQIPVFLGLYNALLNATEMRHSPFALWITDLSAPEALVVGGVPIPVMILFMGASMFLQQKLTPSNMDEQQRKIMMMMPIMFTVMFIIFPFPSGLVLYWLVNNLISIVQQVYLRTDRNVSATQATALASVGIFLTGYLVTLL